MSNVIHVNFAKTKRFSNLNDFVTYLHREGLDVSDIEEILCSIIDTKIYNDADNIVKSFVDVWFDQ